MLYLAPYVGAGTRQDPFRPRGAEGRWSGIDLRPDSTKLEGYALLWLDGLSADRLLEAVGTNKDEPLAKVVETKIGNTLGKTFDSNNITISDFLEDLLLAPPSVKGWPRLRPTSKGVYEAWLNNETWLLLPAVAGGASDNFNRGNETPLAAPWTNIGSVVGASNFNLSSNQITKPSGNDDACYVYSGAASSADQFGEIQIITFSSNNDQGPLVRGFDNGNLNCYVASYFGNFYKYVNTAFTSLANHNDTPTANHYCRLSVSGSTLTLYRDATSPATTSRGSTTDSSLNSGQPGFNSYESGTTMDNWLGDDLSGPAFVAQLMLLGVGK